MSELNALTYDQFLDELRQTPRTWILTDDQRLERSPTCNDCPFLAIHDILHTRTGKYGLAIDRNGADVVKAIFKAADRVIGFDPDMRRDLLTACGLNQGVRPREQEHDTFTILPLRDR